MIIFNKNLKFFYLFFNNSYNFKILLKINFIRKFLIKKDNRITFVEAK